jgi:hypothetical protein
MEQGHPMKLRIKKGFLAGGVILVFLLGSHSRIDGLTYDHMNNAFPFRDPAFSPDFIGWRLPWAIDQGKSDPWGQGYYCTDSKMGDLFYIEGISSDNPASFINIQSSETLLGKANGTHHRYVESIPPELTTMLLLGIGLVILWLCLHAFQKVEDIGVGTFLNRGSFLRMLDLEIKRARRYQNSFCVLILKLSPVPGQEKGKGLQKCYHSLSIWLKGELREIDILGSLGDDQLAALLPYADLSGSRRVRSRLEGKLKNLDFRNDGYEVVIDQISFPKDGTVEDLSARLQG